MRNNPYCLQTSPIIDLYRKSKQRSASYQCSSSPSHSYREFKVKNILNSLANNHIIQKNPQFQREKTMQRQRSLSKIYGVQNLKQLSQYSGFIHILLHMTKAPISRPNQLIQSRKPNQPRFAISNRNQLPSYPPVICASKVDILLTMEHK